MTLEQLSDIARRAFPICNVTAYGSPELRDGVWTVGFKEPHEMAALQVNFKDRDIKNNQELQRAVFDLANQIRGVILMSM